MASACSPGFTSVTNGGKKYNNDEANQAASSDDQRLSEIVPDGLVKFVRKLQYFTLDQDTFHCAILEIGNYNVLLEKCPADIYDVDRINWAARVESLRVGWRFVGC